VREKVAAACSEVEICHADGYTVAAARDGTYSGTITAGVGGIATAGALLVSLFLMRQQMRDLRRARVDRHREHASHVAFWAELITADEHSGDVPVVAHLCQHQPPACDGDHDVRWLPGRFVG
jgi:hypothetical protein